MSTGHARGQRVEVARHVLGLTTFDIGKVVDLPTEEHVRVELDRQPGVARVYDADDVRPIPEAVARHISSLISALGAVSDDERAEVQQMLSRRLGHDDLIGFSRSVAEGLDETYATVAARRGAGGAR